MITFFNPFDLFQGPFIVPLGCDGFQYGGVAGFIEAEVKVNLKSMRIAVISENSQGGVIQLIEMFCLKFHEIHLNRLPETIVLDIHRSVLIDLVYDILVEQIVVSFLNIKARSEENFEIVNFWVVRKCAPDAGGTGHCK